MMAGTLDEMAHGIVMVLQASPKPEPLIVELRGHTYEQALYLAQAVADECDASNAPLTKVEIGESGMFVPGGMKRTFESNTVRLVTALDLGAAIRLRRWQHSPSP